MRRTWIVAGAVALAAGGFDHSESGQASCRGGVLLRGELFTLIADLEPSDLGRALGTATIPPCDDSLRVPSGPEVSVPIRAVRAVSPRFAVAMTSGYGWALADKGGGTSAMPCHGSTRKRQLLPCLRRRSAVSLDVQPAVAHPGEVVRIRVNAPKSLGASGARSVFLKKSTTGSWTPLFDLIQPSPAEGDSPPQTLPFDRNRAVLEFGIPEGTWQPVIVPNVSPGGYRILHSFGRLRLVADLRVEVG